MPYGKCYRFFIFFVIWVCRLICLLGTKFEKGWKTLFLALISFGLNIFGIQPNIITKGIASRLNAFIISPFEKLWA